MNGAGDAGNRQPGAVPVRAIAVLAVLWSGLAGGWFVSIAARGDLRTPAVALAAGLFVAVVWLFGLLMLLLFVPHGADE
ncbi:MAG: hypothetical protein HY262_00430 [Chloroflexi bacterium]|nr:hypothetical protein [Chloroflexota bacterium]